MTNRIEFIVDTRETIRKQIHTAFPEAIFKPLEVGDYQFNVNGYPFLVLERKTLADYAASIRDGRHREQKKRLQVLIPLTKVMYLVEGIVESNRIDHFTKVSHETMVSSMFNTMIRDGIHVLRTSSVQETMTILRFVYSKLAKQGTSFVHMTQTTHQQDLLQQAKPTKKDNYTPELGFQMMLQCVPGISMKWAQHLASKFVSMSALVKQLSVLSHDQQIHRLLSCPLDGRKLSKTAAHQLLSWLGVADSSDMDPTPSTSNEISNSSGEDGLVWVISVKITDSEGGKGKFT